MKPKKKEKERKLPLAEENTQADLEAFLQAFEKPTKIYRYLKTRHLVSPIFLQRSLYYMQHRRSVTNSKRKDFKLESLLEKAEGKLGKTTVKESTQPKYLKLHFVGFYDKQGAPDTDEVEVEAILTQICHFKRKDEPAPVKQTSLGKVCVPVNPVSSSSHLVSSSSKTIIISQEPLSCRNGLIVKSYMLHLSVTCRLQQKVPNGVCNGDVIDVDEPKAKKRKSLHKPELSNRQTDEQANSVEDDVIVYGTELNIYNKREKCLLKSGSYDLVLQELGSKFHTKKDGVWETAGGGKSIESLEVFSMCPTLKFILSWTDDSEGLKPSTISPSEFLTNNQFGSRISFHGFDPNAAAIKLKEEANNTPQKKQQHEHVTYQFSYNDNTRQQTDTRNDLCCPWCSLDCGKLYSLLKHLRLSHARFCFLYVNHPKGSRIDVTVNEHYDGSYAGNPQDLNSHIGYAFSRLGPVRRSQITHVLVYRPKRPPPSLLEFYEDEKENQVTRQIVQGHNRLYYRTLTCLPLRPQELNTDSENEMTPEWLPDKTVNMIDEFTDVNEGEKSLMKLWNIHCLKYGYIADCQIPLACHKFVEDNSKYILEKGMWKNFLLHVVNLFDFSLLHPDIVQRTLWQLYMVKEDLEMSGPGTKAPGPGTGSEVAVKEEPSD